MGQLLRDFAIWGKGVTKRYFVQCKVGLLGSEDLAVNASQFTILLPQLTICNYVTYIEAVRKLVFRNERRFKFRGEAAIMEGKREE